MFQTNKKYRSLSHPWGVHDHLGYRPGVLDNRALFCGLILSGLHQVAAFQVQKRTEVLTKMDRHFPHGLNKLSGPNGQKLSNKPTLKRSGVPSSWVWTNFSPTVQPLARVVRQIKSGNLVHTGTFVYICIYIYIYTNIYVCCFCYLYH